MRRHRVLRLAIIVASALLLGASFAWLSARTSGAHAEPLSQQTTPPAQTAATPPEPTTSPTPAPADLELADSFARQGKVDEAAGAYLAVLADGTVEERLTARLALGRLYLADGQPTPAVRHLEAYLVEAPPGADVRDAQYLLARALALDGRWREALPLYDAYIQHGGGAAVYARLDRAVALAHLGRTADALREAETNLDQDLPQASRAAFTLELAQALEQHAPQEALAWYERLRKESATPPDQALALWRSALLQQEQGDLAAAADSALTLIRQYPATPYALEAVEDFPPVAQAPDPYYAGLVYFHNGKEEQARAIFAQQADAQPPTPNGARAAYYLAVLDERAGDTEGAIKSYGRVPALDPTVEVADDALWWRGRLLEREKRPDEAVASYQRLLTEFPDSTWAAEARFRLALIEYDAGRTAQAAQRFAAIARAAQGEERQRALFWRGKALAAGDDAAGAEEAWRQVRQEAPTRYYGLRAAVLLGDAEGALEDATLAATEPPNWGAIAAWLEERTGADPSDAFEKILSDRDWGLGQELLAVGLRRRANAEFAALLEGAGDDPAQLYQLARFFHALEVPDLSARAATRLLLSLPEEAEEAPADLWRLAYPAPFAELVREAADAEDLPELLLLALVRQESFFDPLAGSPAGALGLTQVIPPTGEAIAQDLGRADFEAEDLYWPALSLRFGAYYLRQQLERFDEDLYAALAAYNAGPGSASRWRRAAGEGIDRFVAEIEFSQTQAYVQLVSENLARYRQLYGDLPEPSLPED